MNPSTDIILKDKFLYKMALLKKLKAERDPIQFL